MPVVTLDLYQLIETATIPIADAVPLLKRNYTNHQIIITIDIITITFSFIYEIYNFQFKIQNSLYQGSVHHT